MLLLQGCADCYPERTCDRPRRPATGALPPSLRRGPRGPGETRILIIFPVYPFSKTLFLAFDLIFRPPTAQDST
jgi:hypothetical protein